MTEISLEAVQTMLLLVTVHAACGGISILKGDSRLYLVSSGAMSGCVFYILSTSFIPGLATMNAIVAGTFAFTGLAQAGGR